MSKKNLFLLDAFALIYRAYYGLGGRAPLTNSKGMNVTAIQLFTRTMYDLLQSEEATHFAVAFDTPEETERSAEYEFYKANREEMPEDIAISLPYIKEIIHGFNIPLLEAPGYEADDIIGTLAKKAEKKGFKVYMVTSDKDYAQLVSENIFMYKPQYKGRGYDIVGVPEVKEKWLVERPEQVIDILGMWGDAVDNIPGIPGVGEKTAKKFIQQFGSLEGLLENTDQLKGKMKENVIAYAEQGKLSKDLATIILDVPVKLVEKDLIISKPDKEKLTSIFADLEFRTLGKQILGDDYTVVQPTSSDKPDLFNQGNGTPKVDSPKKSEKKKKSAKGKYHLVSDPQSRKDLLEKLLKQKEVCFDTETTGLDPNLAEIVGVAFSFKEGEAFYVNCPEDQDETKKILKEFDPFWKNEKVIKIAHNLKYDLMVLNCAGIELSTPVFDSMIAHYLLRPELRHNMDTLSENYLNHKTQSIEELIGKKGKNQKSMRDVPIEEVRDYAGEDADITFQLAKKFQPMLKSENLDQLFREVEIPLIPVLAKMEMTGVSVDSKFLKQFSKDLEKDALKFRDKIYKTAGADFNLNSPKQLGEILFDKLKIPYEGKRTKTGQYSTSEDILSKLASEHAIAQDILAFREVSKLKSTYVDALPKLINPKTGRIHSSFRQAVVPTGRLSSDKPNLQNIPIRTERGRMVRTAFVSGNPNFKIFSADYSQVELRIIAALGKETNMIEAFKNGEDIHSATASKVFGVPLKEVDREMRRKAKAVNFGLAYGQSAFGLAQSLNISRTEAKEIIENYFEKYPGILNYMEESKEYARKHGFVKTIMGRKRNLPDINSRNNTVRSFAERNAINTPIQGSAADIIKKAMIDIDVALGKEKMKSRMILQVHDELVFEVHKSELEALKDLVHEKMSNAVTLEVPLTVDSGIGENWLEAH